MSNAFALLQIEGEDPVENVPAPKAAPAAAASSTPAAAKPQRTQQAPRNNNNATRGTRAPRNNGGDRTPAGTDAVESDLTRDVRGERTAGQRGGRGSGNRGRGARGARPVGGNRPMDRHSMTDRTDSHKQEHQAWGGDEGKRELNDENDGEKDAQAAVSGVATPVGDAPSTPIAAAQPEVEAEPEDNTKTYQEWLAEQKKENIGGDLPEARKPNEGADDSQWKDAVAIKKEEDDEVLFAQTKEGKARKQKEKKEKSFIEIELNYPRPGSENTRGRGGRGRGEGRGRGGDRGGRGRGGNSQRGTPRSNGPRAAAAPAVDDASAFPSLS